MITNLNQIYIVRRPAKYIQVTTPNEVRRLLQESLQNKCDLTVRDIVPAIGNCAGCGTVPQMKETISQS